MNSSVHVHGRVPKCVYFEYVVSGDMDMYLGGAAQLLETVHSLRGIDGLAQGRLVALVHGLLETNLHPIYGRRHSSTPMLLPCCCRCFCCCCCCLPKKAAGMARDRILKHAKNDNERQRTTAVYFLASAAATPSGWGQVSSRATPFAKKSACLPSASPSSRAGFYEHTSMQPITEGGSAPFAPATKRHEVTKEIPKKEQEIHKTIRAHCCTHKISLPPLNMDLGV